jgi:hypothetical protein
LGLTLTGSSTPPSGDELIVLHIRHSSREPIDPNEL